MTTPHFGRDRHRARDEGTDAAVELKQMLERHLSGSDYEHACELVDALAEGGASDEPSRIPGSPRPGGAMDSGLRVYAMDAAAPVRRMQDISAAEREVEPHVGAVLGMDSAAAVFREACRRLGVDAASLPAAALPVMFRTVRRGHNAGGGGVSNPPRPHNPQSSADFARRFPDAARVRSLG